jgi:hypothetical protein
VRAATYGHWAILIGTFIEGETILVLGSWEEDGHRDAGGGRQPGACLGEQQLGLGDEEDLVGRRGDPRGIHAAFHAGSTRDPRGDPHGDPHGIHATIHATIHAAIGPLIGRLHQRGHRPARPPRIAQRAP